MIRYWMVLAYVPVVQISRDVAAGEAWNVQAGNALDVGWEAQPLMDCIAEYRIPVDVKAPLLYFVLALVDTSLVVEPLAVHTCLVDIPYPAAYSLNIAV